MYVKKIFSVLLLSIQLRINYARYSSSERVHCFLSKQNNEYIENIVYIVSQLSGARKKKAPLFCS